MHTLSKLEINIQIMDLVLHRILFHLASLKPIWKTTPILKLPNEYRTITPIRQG